MLQKRTLSTETVSTMECVSRATRSFESSPALTSPRRSRSRGKARNQPDPSMSTHLIQVHPRNLFGLREKMHDPWMGAKAATPNAYSVLMAEGSRHQRVRQTAHDK